MSLTTKYYVYTTLASVVLTTLSVTTSLGIYYGMFASLFVGALFIIGGVQLGKRENK